MEWDVTGSEEVLGGNEEEFWSHCDMRPALLETGRILVFILKVKKLKPKTPKSHYSLDSETQGLDLLNTL